MKGTQYILNLIFELGFDYDRMSTSGKETYNKLWYASGADEVWPTVQEEDNEQRYRIITV